MRILAVGDVHGCLTALDALLTAVALQAGDTLVMLGDYVDRGPDSKGVLDRLIQLRRRAEIVLVPILGNHDQMMLEARAGKGHDWLCGYGLSTLASYGLNTDDVDRVPAEHWQFLEQCVDYYETEHHLFVHANADPDQALEACPDTVLRWKGINPDRARPHQSGKILVCGHASQQNGRPLNLGHSICIDTYAHGGGWLTCLDVHAGSVWMSNQCGAVQTGSIRDH